MAHNTAHLIDYTQRLASMAHMPVRLEVQAMPDPSASYSLAQMMAYAPNAETYSTQVAFIFAFYAAKPLNQFVPSLLEIPGAAPLWKAKLPFSPLTAAGRAANTALVDMRKEVSAFLAAIDNPLLRMSKGNYQSPTRLPRSITL